MKCDDRIEIVNWSPTKFRPLKIIDDFVELCFVDWKVFAIGGRLHPASFVYELSIDQWRDIAPVPEPRDMFSLTPCGDSIYLIGGKIFSNFIIKVDRYIIDQNRWCDNQVKLPTGISNPGTVKVSDHQVFIFGGQTCTAVTVSSFTMDTTNHLLNRAVLLKHCGSFKGEPAYYRSRVFAFD